MSFWNAEVKADTKDPKRNFRFIVEFDGLGDGGSQIWYAKKVDKPNYTITESKHSYLDKTYYWPGRLEWQKITLTLVDPVSPNAVGKMTKMIEDAGYTLSSKPDNMQTMSKANFAKAIGGGKDAGTIRIIQLDSSGKTEHAVEKWTLKNAWISMMKFGTLDYENDDLTELELELRYDWAECKTGEQEAFTAGGA